MLSEGLTSNLGLINEAKRLNIQLTDVIFVRDILKQKRFNTVTKEPLSLIMELQDSNGGIGHWVALYKDLDRYIYFDSFGQPPPTIVYKYCKPFNVQYSTKQIQNINSGWCGSYCLAFLYYMQHDKSLEQFQAKFDDYE